MSENVQIGTQYGPNRIKHPGTHEAILEVLATKPNVLFSNVELSAAVRENLNKYYILTETGYPEDRYIVEIARRIITSQQKFGAGVSKFVRTHPGSVWRNYTGDKFQYGVFYRTSPVGKFVFDTNATFRRGKLTGNEHRAFLYATRTTVSSRRDLERKAVEQTEADVIEVIEIVKPTPTTAEEVLRLIREVDALKEKLIAEQEVWEPIGRTAEGQVIEKNKDTGEFRVL